MTLSEARERQAKLKTDGASLLKDLDIESILSKFGTVEIEGSYSYNLMVVPDIDLTVFVEDPIQKMEEISSLAARLTKINNVRKLLFVKSGYLKPPSEGKPKGLYIGLEILHLNIFWNLDIWFATKKEIEAVTLGFDMKSLTNNQKDAILMFKYEANEAKLYGYKNKYYSADIYKAVVLGNARTLKDLEAFKNVK